jgi:hypothetical protein
MAFNNGLSTAVALADQSGESDRFGSCWVVLGREYWTVAPSEARREVQGTPALPTNRHGDRRVHCAGHSTFKPQVEYAQMGLAQRLPVCAASRSIQVLALSGEKKSDRNTQIGLYFCFFNGWFAWCKPVKSLTLQEPFMAKKITAASSSNIALSTKRPEDLLHGDEIEALFDQNRPGFITVLGKFTVTPTLYQLTASLLDELDSHLIFGVEYSTQELIGDLWWNYFGPEDFREFELCVKHFATHPKATLKDLHNGTFKLV